MFVIQKRMLPQKISTMSPYNPGPEVEERVNFKVEVEGMKKVEKLELKKSSRYVIQKRIFTPKNPNPNPTNT